MPPTVVDLENITVRQKHTKLSLTITTSFTIDLPSAVLDPSTAAEISQLSKTGELWVAKAGSCQVDFLTLVNGEHPECAGVDPKVASTVVDLAADCPIWEDVGLQLKAKHCSGPVTDEQPSLASYFLHHPDLSSDTIAQSSIPCGRFQGLKCEINFCLDNWRTTQYNDESLRRADLMNGTSATTQKHGYGLRKNPTPSRKAWDCLSEMENMGTDPFSEHPLPPGTDITREQEEGEFALPSVPEITVTDMAALLDSALRKLIGLKKASPGIRSVCGMSSPALTDIAPAVWNLQYLESMTAHAQLIPSIANRIARLKNARSSSLRQKVERLASLGAPKNASTEPDNPDNSDDGVRSVVSKRLWKLCQTGIKAEPIFKTRSGTGVASQPVMQQQSTGSGPDLDFEFTEFEETTFPQWDVYTDFVIPEDPFQKLWQHGHMFGSEVALDGDDEFLEYEPYCTKEEEDYDMVSSDLRTDENAESDYFYADGYGNVYPVEREEALLRSAELEWPSSPPLHSASSQLDSEEGIFTYLEE
ncbi:hypothetical protein B0H66DRAFT_605937 [Apodospora peruviana]|uniref:Uncharacterized protein n=1 Tax=Apodospora peruviana TaxID=516989 RepID=A0AAE0M116_9PEZI|nr:hypothetical protein B0H66DRAFT_605937 [Apodospora peruviana]